MKIKGIADEDFVNYKLPSMFIIAPTCTFKCDKENECQMCQNSHLAREKDIKISKEDLIKRYMSNPITKAIVFGGLEPFDSPMDLLSFVDCARRKFQCDDPIVIYTGYTEDEILSGNFDGANPNILKTFISNMLENKNIVIKYGRFRPNQESHYDSVLGVKLASDNQYAKEYNFENNTQ